MAIFGNNGELLETPGSFRPMSILPPAASAGIGLPGSSRQPPLNRVNTFQLTAPQPAKGGNGFFGPPLDAEGRAAVMKNLMSRAPKEDPKSGAEALVDMATMLAGAWGDRVQVQSAQKARDEQARAQAKALAGGDAQMEEQLYQLGKSFDLSKIGGDIIAKRLAGGSYQPMPVTDADRTRLNIPSDWQGYWEPDGSGGYNLKPYSSGGGITIDNGDAKFPGMMPVYDENGAPIMDPVEGGGYVPRMVPAVGSEGWKAEREAERLDKERLDDARKKYLTIRQTSKEIRELLQSNPEFLQTGFVGGQLKNIEGTAAYALNQKLNTLRALVGFEALQDMRDASKTGGALGQVSEMENILLQSVWGSLEIGQDGATLLRNIRRIEAATAIAVDGGGTPLMTNPDGSPMIDENGKRMTYWGYLGNQVEAGNLDLDEAIVRGMGYLETLERRAERPPNKAQDPATGGWGTPQPATPNPFSIDEILARYRR